MEAYCIDYFLSSKIQEEGFDCVISHCFSLDIYFMDEVDCAFCLKCE